jgi:hypothetical protein
MSNSFGAFQIIYTHFRSFGAISDHTEPLQILEQFESFQTLSGLRLAAGAQYDPSYLWESTYLTVFVFVYLRASFQ